MEAGISGKKLHEHHGGDHSARAKVVKKKKTGKKKAKKASVEKNIEPSGVEDKMKIKSQDLAIVFNPKRDVIKPYHTDGDSEMYTEEILEKRKALKSEPLVIETINDFLTLY